MNENVFEIFHPLISKWFQSNLGEPTDVQSKCWPLIAAEENVLVTAPTGSGKTLAAFLWAIDRLVTGEWLHGQVRVLYISPLKALNNDVQKNLIGPLQSLKEYFTKAGGSFPEIRVMTRSGDTPESERRKITRQPPEILITTPESINLMLSSVSGRKVLRGIASVILDEIHSVINEKRGVHLMSAIERLVLLSGEFQRIALSATVKPLSTVADFIGGYIPLANPGERAKRKVKIVSSMQEKRYEVSVRFPAGGFAHDEKNNWWPALIESFKEIIRENRATLFFSNSRRMVEKVTRMINEEEPFDLAYSHHGSLSRELRMEVEKKLKHGELKAIVATASLELGIDIGELDRVVLIQAPFSVSSAIQRIGRAGHAVGKTSRGDLFPIHGGDNLNCAVMARCILEKNIEKVRPVQNPLDVLSQVILSMTGVEDWDVETLYSFFLRIYSYHQLVRRQFFAVLEMLSGKFSDTRMTELSPKISWDRIDGTVRAKKGALIKVYTAGGTIPDRGYFNLRVEETGSRIGELDEEFVWERHVGDTFPLGSRIWRIKKITENEVVVAPTTSGYGIVPFWRAEGLNRDFHLSEQIGLFLEKAETWLCEGNREPEFAKHLQKQYAMEAAAANELYIYLKRQKEATKTELAHRYNLVVEHFDDPLNTSDSKQVILHTFWGGRVNRPFGLALAAAWEASWGYPPEIYCGNDSILFLLPHAFSSEDILKMVHAENVEYYLHKQLEGSGFFGARFRENAGRALLLPRAGFKKRMPLWLNRLRSKKLMNVVKSYDDFPILLETWRTCLQDEFDLENLKTVLEEVGAGIIRVTEAYTRSASPFASDLIWRQINQHMYEDDSPTDRNRSSLNEELIQEAVKTSHLRPLMDDILIEELESKLKRTAPDYSPADSGELLDWIKERRLIPEKEWENILSACLRDHGLSKKELTEPISHKALRLHLPGAKTASVCAVETLPGFLFLLGISLSQLEYSPLLTSLNDNERLESTIASYFILHKQSTEKKSDEIFSDDRMLSWEKLLLHWLSFYTPMQKTYIRSVFGFSQKHIDHLIGPLIEKQQIIEDRFRKSSSTVEICERENLEILLRLMRRSRQPSFEALELSYLPLFLADFQGVAVPGENMEDMEDRLERLFGYPAPVREWEETIFPSRMKHYHPSWLDRLMQSTDLAWFGRGPKKIAFGAFEEREVFLGKDLESEQNKETTNPESLFPDVRGKYSFFDISRYTGKETKELTETLWELAWKGNVANYSFQVIREGIVHKFKPAPAKNTGFKKSRRSFKRWKASRPITGSWYLVDPKPPVKDMIEKEDLQKDRVRLLFLRYGVLFREILIAETKPFAWKNIVKTLRRMELSGEILSGWFFQGIPGIQFISREAFRILNRPLPEDAVYWISAIDPASVCGIALEDIKPVFPSRRNTTHIVFHGKHPVLFSRRNGKILEFQVDPEHPDIQKYLGFFKTLLGREFNPVKVLEVNTINGDPALKSPYAKALKDFGFETFYDGLELRKRM